MRVYRGVVPAVVEDHHLPITSQPAVEKDLTRRCRLHRRVGWRGDIKAGVNDLRFEDRVDALSVLARYLSPDGPVEH